MLDVADEAGMTQMPPLEDVAAQLEAQDRELAIAADLAATIPDGHTVDESFVRAIEDATEPGVVASNPLFLTGIRA